MRTNEKSKVLDAFLNGAIIIDGHDDKEITRECSLVKLSHPERPVCLFIHGARYQCLNGVWLDENTNTLRLSQMSEGGVIEGEITPDSVKEYNETVTIDGIKITEWIDRDGTIHSVEVDA